MSREEASAAGRAVPVWEALRSPADKEVARTHPDRILNLALLAAHPTQMLHKATFSLHLEVVA